MKPWREVFTEKDRAILAEAGVGSYLFASGIVAILAAADEADALLAENVRLKAQRDALADALKGWKRLGRTTYGIVYQDGETDRWSNVKEMQDTIAALRAAKGGA